MKQVHSAVEERWEAGDYMKEEGIRMILGLGFRFRIRRGLYK